jgi:hypothetical protein
VRYPRIKTEPHHPALTFARRSALKIKANASGGTTLEYVIHPNAGGKIPDWVIRRYMGLNLAYVTEVKDYVSLL